MFQIRWRNINIAPAAKYIKYFTFITACVEGSHIGEAFLRFP